jgi:hypothetical protein
VRIATYADGLANATRDGAPTIIFLWLQASGGSSERNSWIGVLRR